MFEECEPEDLSILGGSQLFTNPFRQIIVHDVSEVDLVDIIGLAVLDGQALGLDLLGTILLYVR